MRYSKLQFLTFFLVFNFWNLTAQEYTLPQYVDIVQYDHNGPNFISILVSDPEDPYIGRRGTPFLFKENVDGSILLEDSIRIKDLVMNYDIFLQQMRVYKNDSLYATIYPYRVEEVHLDDKTFVHVLYDRKEKSFFGYFERLVDGDWLLLKRYICNFRPGYYCIPLSAGDRSYKYEKHISYYLKTKGEAAVKIVRNKKNIFAVLPGNDKDLEKYIKENKLNVYKEEDLVTLIKYYNFNNSKSD